MPVPHDRPTFDQILYALKTSGEAGDILCTHAVEEIERLMLTAEERAEIEALADEMKTLELCYGEDDLCRRQSDRYGSYARILTAMLKRTELRS